MSRNSWLILLACAFLLLCSLPVFAATQNAVVYGTVYDAAGNPMAGVTVTLDNPAFGFSRTTTTGSDGSYNFAEVPPAEGYRITASMGGKKVDTRTGIAVNVGDERVILPPLKEQAVAAAPAPGVAPAPAPAAAEGPAISPEFPATAIGGVITRDQLLALPLYNRNFLALGLITPNTHDVQQGSELAGASFSVAGNRPESNNFLLDGSDNVAASSNQAIPFQVNDSIQEFRVISSAGAAEYGRGQGGVVNVVTRRATNQVHGSVYGYFGDQALNADSALSVYNNTTFDKAAAYAGPLTATALPTSLFGLPAAPTSYNQYVATAVAGVGGFFGPYCTDSIGLPGGTVPCITGGFGKNTLFDPAAILKAHGSRTIPFDSKQFGINIGGPLKRDKLFLFGSYEGTLINNDNPIFERVPSTFDRTYGALNARDPVDYPLPSFLPTDPNYVLAQKVLSLYPKANVIGVPDALEFFRGEAPNYTDVHNGLARADWVQSDKSTWSFRYVVQGLNQLHDDTLPRSSAYPGNGAIRTALNHNLNISFSHTISSTLLNEFHAGFNRFRIDETAQDIGVNIPGVPSSGTGVPSFFLSGLDTQYSGNCSNAAPNICGIIGGAFAGWADTFWFGSLSPMMPTLDGLFPMARIGAPLNAPSQRIDTTAFAGDSLSWSNGKHSFRFGGEFRHLNDHFFDGSFSRGFVVSSNIGEFTNDSETCNFACFGAFNFPSFDYAQKQSAPYLATFNSYAVSGFAQDTWRIYPRVTISFGVRYDFFGVPTEENNRIWNFDSVAHGLVQQNNSGVFDPFGNQCTGVPAAAYPNQGAPAFGFMVSQNWNCHITGSNRIANNNTHDFAPRAGLAWDVFGTGKTVFRGGFGLYYDQMPIVDTANLMYNRPTLFNSANPQLIYGQSFFGVCFSCGFGNATLSPSSPAFFANGQSASSPFGMMARDVAHSATPYTLQFNATLQQQLGRHAVVEAGYIGSRGHNLPAVFNSNFNDQWFCTNTPPPPPFGVTRCDTNSFFPVFTMTNRASSTYDSVMARVRVAQWHGLRVNATYTYSKSQDNASSGIFPLLPTTLSNFVQQIQFNGTGNPGVFCYGSIIFSFGIPGFCPPLQGGGVASSLALTTTGAGAVNVSRYLIPQDPNNFLQNDLGNSDFDVPHRFVLDYTWEVPGKGAWKGNWLLSGIFIAQSGQPFTIFAGPIFGEIDQRVNLIGPVTQDNSNPNNAISRTNLRLASTPCLLSQPGVNKSPFVSGGAPFTGTAFSPCTGNSKRNQFMGPNYITWNMAIQKGFHIFGEGRMLTLRAEFYNLTDRANFNNPISQLSLDGVGAIGGQIQNPEFGKIKSVKEPRQIQFGARFTF